MVGNSRFTNIQNSFPKITPKVLAKELQELEVHQLIIPETNSRDPKHFSGLESKKEIGKWLKPLY